MSRRRGKPRIPDFLLDLSRAPEKPWPSGAYFHGARIGLLVLLAFGLTFLFPSESHRTPTRYTQGAVAEEDVTAEIGFSIPKTPEELARDQTEAEAFVPPTFFSIPEARDSMESRLVRFFDEVERAAGSGGRPAVERVLAREGITILEGQSQPFLDPLNRRVLREASLQVARELVPLVLDANDAVLLTTGRVTVRDALGSERSVPADSLLWGREFFNQALDRLHPATPDLQSIFRLIIIRFFEASYVLDVVATEGARNQARQAVPTAKGGVVAGQVIVRRGDVIGEAEMERLVAYEDALRTEGQLGDPGLDWGSLLGAFFLNLLLLSLFGFLLFLFRTEVYRNFRYVFVQALVVAAYFLGAWMIARQGFPSEFLPIVFAALPVAVLWDGRMALVLALLLGLITGLQPPFREFSILVVTSVGGAVAALSARAIRRRSQVWIFIALITLGYSWAILSLGLVERVGTASVLLSIAWAAGNATVSAILAMGFMPLFEWFTGITTDQTLLEWVDPNRPLLKRLSMEAGGTYAHTIGVANLAEAAATTIGANGLLTRVGVYYHDVGKMLKPQFFVENQHGGRNPHDKLKPHTSAAIVREHVLEGERMARDEGVPEAVVRFIPEHHGTQLIGFFWEKAREESAEEPNVDEFRYPGPKPRSRETAIVMLADSVESATRALQDPSPDRVRELIRTIVDGKIRDGQLSESPLTLGELSAVQEAFAKVIGGMFHHRLDYPATRHITEAQRANPDHPEAEEQTRDGGGVEEVGGPEGGVIRP